MKFTENLEGMVWTEDNTIPMQFPRRIGIINKFTTHELSRRPNKKEWAEYAAEQKWHLATMPEIFAVFSEIYDNLKDVEDLRQDPSATQAFFWKKHFMDLTNINGGKTYMTGTQVTFSSDKATITHDYEDSRPPNVHQIKRPLGEISLANILGNFEWHNCLRTLIESYELPSNIENAFAFSTNLAQQNIKFDFPMDPKLFAPYNLLIRKPTGEKSIKVTLVPADYKTALAYGVKN